MLSENKHIHWFPISYGCRDFITVPNSNHSTMNKPNPSGNFEKSARNRHILWDIGAARHSIQIFARGNTQSLRAKLYVYNFPTCQVRVAGLTFCKRVSVLDFRMSDTLHYSYSEESEIDHDGPETESSESSQLSRDRHHHRCKRRRPRRSRKRSPPSPA